MADARQKTSSLPATAPASESKRTAASAPASAPVSASGLRDTADTVVFVIVLVLLLKTFVAEAFVIPTGSMATSLWGDQKSVTCPQCDFAFPVNCSSERDEDRKPDTVVGCVCPNCRYHIEFHRDGLSPTCRSGDRVMVAKYLYDLSLDDVDRHDVVVFKFPKEPQKKFSPLNYIKRLAGEPNETVGIYYGDIYVYPDRGNGEGPLTYPGRPRPNDPTDLWQHPYMYENDDEAVTLFRQGKFAIARKSPSKILAMRRPVYDNDHPARDLLQAGYPPRWAPEKDDGEATSVRRPSNFLRNRERGHLEAAWVADNAHGFRHTAKDGALAWLRYRNLLVDRPDTMGMAAKSATAVQPELVTDFLGYDTWQLPVVMHGTPPPNWVGDLILECEVTVEAGAGADRQLILELSSGADRFQARWELTSGACSLVRVIGEKEETLVTQATALKAPGTYQLRFANVDQRLTVWVDGQLPFGDGIAYLPPVRRGPTVNDLEPASIAARGTALGVRKLQLWRDTYYTLDAGRPDAPQAVDDWSDPERWAPLRELPVKTLYVQPDHFLCLGDNSPESADGRQWGLVPRRLMIGRALVVYWPIWRIGPIK